MSRLLMPWMGLALMVGSLLTGLPMALLSPAVAGQSQTTPVPVVAVVNGKEITEQELVDRVRGELLKFEAQIYEVRRNGVEELISEYLLEQVAKARGLTGDELLQQDVDSKVDGVTAKEIEDFYAANKARIRKSLNEVRPQLLNYLQQNKLTEARRTYLKGLRDKAQVKINLTPPIVEVSAEGAPFKGPPSAPITIVEFSDFQCAYCKQVLAVLNQVLERYPDQVKLAFRDFPILNIHPQAQKAAEAAHCASEQGKFWEYHDLLFEKQDAIPTTNFAEHAKALGLEPTSFQTCLDSQKYKEKVERNYADGVKAGVSGTPAFFINGRLVSGAQPLEAFKAVIDEELDRLGPQAQR
ncbi:MAG TPA: thioredoxin domain-containing protein [Candidatus Tectomicrobia bacterium]